MNIENLSDDELLAELTRRNEARQKVEEVKPADVLVFGITCIDGKEDVIEIFNKIEKPEDLPNLFVMEMRARMNSHRFYRKFYFKVSLEDYDLLLANIKKDNAGTAAELCKNPNIKFETM